MFLLFQEGIFRFQPLVFDGVRCLEHVSETFSQMVVGLMVVYHGTNGNINLNKCRRSKSRL